MDQPPQSSVFVGWAVILGSVLLGAATLKELLFTEQETFLFSKLPQETRNHIIEMAGLYTTAETLEIAAHTINSLAQVNKESNQKINDPIFCLQIIKYLAKKFNHSDFQVCLALKTHAAKQRLELQKKLCDLCLDTPSTPMTQRERNNLNDNLIFLCKQGADVNFTYPISRRNLHQQKDEIIIMTPLMIASVLNYEMIPPLLSQKADINMANFEGTTALMFAATARNLTATKYLCRHREILDVNKQDSQGNTALMFSILPSPYHDAETIFFAITKTILKAGANPDLANNDSITPRQEAIQSRNNEIIKLFEKY